MPTTKKQKLTPAQRSQAAKDRWAKRCAAAPDATPAPTPPPPPPEQPPVLPESYVAAPNPYPVTSMTAEMKYPVPAPQLAPAAPKKQKRYTGPKEFSVALKAAESRLAKALVERAQAAAHLANLQAEIPSLMGIIQALKGSGNYVPPQVPYGIFPPEVPLPQFQAPYDPVAIAQSGQPAPPVSMARGGVMQLGPDVTGTLEGPEDDDMDKFITGPAAEGRWI